jgi:hypothetical protein
MGVGGRLVAFVLDAHSADPRPPLFEAGATVHPPRTGLPALLRNLLEPYPVGPLGRWLKLVVTETVLTQMSMDAASTGFSAWPE